MLRTDLSLSSQGRLVFCRKEKLHNFANEYLLNQLG